MPAVGAEAATAPPPASCMRGHPQDGDMPKWLLNKAYVGKLQPPPLIVYWVACMNSYY